MASGFRGIVIALLLTGLFAIAIINGGILLASLNSPNQTIANDAAIVSYASSLNATLEQAYSDVNASESAISASPLTLTTGIPFIDAISGIWKTMKKAPVTIWNLSANYVFVKLFGSPEFAIVIGTISAILLIIIVLAVWELVSTGRAGGDR